MDKFGTPGWAAPEIFSGEGYSTKVDIFSLGAFLFYLLNERCLFLGKTAKEIMSNNIDGNLDHVES